ncbi:MAG: hypothetical protein HFE76_16085 [Firmicutes bacterium]|nr:hypothetical protein [Bacillota bacterium]
MKQFDSRNIDRRAGRLLDYHVGLLKGQHDEFALEGQSYYCRKGEQEAYMKIGYNKRKKLLSRTFNLEVSSILYDIDFPEDFSLKLRFKGFPNITGAFFQGQKTSKKYESFFQQADLMEHITYQAKKVELAYVNIQHSKAARKMEITVCPYAGAFLWVIFPPVFYDMRLKREEMVAVHRTAELITEHITKYFGQ